MRKRKAFALILAISAMSFMVLLTLTLSSVVSSKLRLLNAQKGMRSARANAVLGMSVAISQLQAKLGKDNAITFPASIFDEDVTTLEVNGVATPYIFGSIDVKKDASGMSPKELQEEQQLIISDLKSGNPSSDISWFVSSEKALKDPITDTMESLSSETVTLAEFKTITSYPNTFGGDLPADSQNTKVQVKAGKVTFSTTDNNNADGAYAWWVSDESMKAKINLIRPEKYLYETTGNATDAKAPSDTRLPQISNTSFVPEIKDLNTNPFLNSYDEEAAKTLTKLNSLEELALIDTAYSNWSKNNKNDWTTSSVGLPVDVTQGRLKEDLTAYIEGGHGLDDKDVIIRGSNSDRNYTGVNFGLTDKENNLPQFGHIKDWATMAKGKDSFTDSIEPKIYTMNNNNPKHGLVPMLLKVSYVFQVGYEFEPGQDNLYNPTTARIKLYLMFYPRIWIWNPHNVGLAETTYIIRLYMPFRTQINRNPGTLTRPDTEVYTTWYIQEQDDQGNLQQYGAGYPKPYYYKKDNIQGEVRFYYKYSGSRPSNFASIFNEKSAGGEAVMNFQIQNLALRPGENVELIAEGSAPDNPPQEYKDVSPLNIGNYNKLVVDSLAKVKGFASTTGAQAGHGIKINLLPNDQELVLEYSSASFNGSTSSTKTVGKYKRINIGTGSQTDGYINATCTDEDGNEDVPIKLVPVSNMPYEKNIYELNYDGYPASKVPYIHCWWNVLAEEYARGGANNTSYPMYGYEIQDSGGRRLTIHDPTEYKSGGTVSSNNVANFRFAGSGGKLQRAHRNSVTYQPTWGFTNAGKTELRDNAYSQILPTITALHKTTWTDDEINNATVRTFYKGIGNGNLNALQLMFQGSFQQAYGFREQGFLDNDNPIFTANNMHSGATIDDRGSFIKRPESSKNSQAAHGVAYKFTYPISTSLDRHFGNGKNLYHPGAVSWEIGRAIQGEEGNAYTPNDDAFSLYSKQAGDGYSNRFGTTTYLNGQVRYPYAYIAAAPLDYPRDKDGYDLMSLGMLAKTNLQPYPWQPTFAFGEGFASPFMDRHNVFERSNALELDQPNMLIDISYLLNSSMWDRFYLSTIPNRNTNKLKAGMRLPNTRYFLKSVPEDSAKLYGDDDAFQNSAAYVGIDGPFNVNTTSYVAWRAFLGGMLGTKKKTQTGTYINSNPSNSDPEKFMMPFPGMILPLTIPSDKTDRYYTWKDGFIGRSISEAEIDQLAREIVKEVKRRAPFFSLADFINRRLIAYSDVRGESFQRESEELNKSVQSLMGTMSAAIYRSVQDTKRPDFFFNSLTLGNNFTQADIDARGSSTYTRKMITAWDGNDAGNKTEGSGQGSMKDVGENLKDNETQYLEHVFGAPLTETNYNTRLHGSPGHLKQSDILAMIGPYITVRGDTFVVRAYGESKNPMTGTTSKAYCEAVVQRSSEPIDPQDDVIAPESPFGRRFNIVSFRWLTPAEL